MILVLPTMMRYILILGGIMSPESKQPKTIFTHRTALFDMLRTKILFEFAIHLIFQLRSNSGLVPCSSIHSFHPLNNGN